MPDDPSRCGICRRKFLGLAGLAALCACLPGGKARAQALKQYAGPNVIIVRFGGGVRRRETIDPDHTYAPYLRHVLAPQGTLFTNMSMAEEHGAVPSHGEGTLYLLTGKYEEYRDVDGKAFGLRYEPKVPTLFEYLRGVYAIPSDEALIINGEDRKQEEYYTFSQHQLYGLDYRAETVSLYRYKVWLAQQQLQEARSEEEKAEISKQLQEMQAFDYRGISDSMGTARLDAFWSDWRRHYGDDGFKNPRGDRLLTELAIRSMRMLRPKLMMINYQDPDYVHFGNATHYTRGISVIDHGVEELVTAINADPVYRANTVLVIVPDCGRDTNSLMAVPFQHHFKSRSSFDIWALLIGPSIQKGQIVDHPVQQVDVAATVAHLMGFEANFGEGQVLGAAL